MTKHSNDDSDYEDDFESEELEDVMLDDEEYSEASEDELEEEESDWDEASPAKKKAKRAKKVVGSSDAAKMSSSPLILRGQEGHKLH
jgi:hypothetical protein